MAVGPHPNVRGVLNASAICASCGGSNGEDRSAKYQQYGGAFGPSGLPTSGCTSPGNCPDDIFFKPTMGGETG